MVWRKKNIEPFLKVAILWHLTRQILLIMPISPNLYEKAGLCIARVLQAEDGGPVTERQDIIAHILPK